MKRAIRSMALVLAAVAGLVAFTPTEARADHYWSSTHHRNVTYHFAYNDSHGYPVYVNEFGQHFRFGHRGHRTFVSTHHDYDRHDYGHGRHGSLFGLIFGH